jgi:tetratricopeptide (TPR) repeat protein
MKTKVLVFISYAHKDKVLKDRLEEHLSNLKYRGLITTWHDREISAGDNWQHEISTHLESAAIVLLLISASFMASHYCYSIEMKRAIERHQLGEARVIPVLLRPVMFTGAPFAQLQWLPSNGQSVATWRNRDSAFVDIALGIERALQEHEGSWTYRWSDENQRGTTRGGGDLWEEAYMQNKELRYYEQSLSAYESALKRDHADLAALKGKGTVLEALKRYDEAINVFRQLATHTPHPFPYTRIGDIFMKMKQVPDAIAAYEQAIRYDDQYALAYDGMGRALAQLGKIGEAEQARERAKQLGYEDW